MEAPDDDSVVENEAVPFISVNIDDYESSFAQKVSQAAL